MAIRFQPSLPIMVAMGLGLALFYRASVLMVPLALPLLVAGLLLFSVLAVWRPDLGLLFVPLSAPLYLIPASIPAIRASGFVLPLHEVVLLIVTAATLLQKLYGLVRMRPLGITFTPAAFTSTIQVYLPQLLLVLAATIGVLLAVERGAALREVRWMIIEPLIFFWLLNTLVSDQPPAQSNNLRSVSRVILVHTTIIAGAIVAIFGLLQFVGVDLVGIFGSKTTAAFSDNTVRDSGVLRVTSVYGHPNNLGLALGRVWPLAAALALLPAHLQPNPHRRGLLWLAVALILAGIGVSFSRGALLGAGAALVVFLFGLLVSTPAPQGGTSWLQVRRSPLLIASFAVLAAVALLAGLAFSLRGGAAGGSTPVRLLIWQEALGYLWQHPFGLGPDQFYYYHNPEHGRSQIDPSLIGTSEQYAAHPHNLLLDTWLRLGPLGLIAFGWLLVRFVRQAVAALRQAALPEQRLALGALAAMGAALVHGLVDNFYFVPDLAISFWLLIFLVTPHHETYP